MPGIPGVPPPGNGIGTQTSSSDNGSIDWIFTQPWHFYVVLGVAFVLTVLWTLDRLRAEAIERTEWCGWCQRFGCRCSRRDKRRRRPR